MRKRLWVKTIVLLLSWLTLSPLLLILDGRWKLLPKWLRIVLFMLSPLMVIVIVLAVLLANGAAVEWPDNNQYFQRESEIVDWESIYKEIEADLATIKTSPCIHVDMDSLSIYYPNFSRIDLVTGVMPDKLNDTTVVLCCEAAFTGECLTEFKHTNIAGDHVSSGVRYRGYRCKRNTGAFVWYENGWKFLWNDYSHELDSAAQHNGMGFGQEMIIHQGALCETIRKDWNVNQFRTLCEVDGRVCIIDGKMSMPFGAFKKLLVAYGVTEALYLDMGAGWNHSWYRDENGNAVDIYPYQHPYCTNWLTFYK